MWWATARSPWSCRTAGRCRRKCCRRTRIATWLLLRVEASELPTIPLGDSRALHAGQWVMAIGHPWGIEGGATAGIVIGIGATWPETPANGRDWVVASLHMRPGHSGGALVDVRGRLVGINTMINGPDVGVAIPTHVVIDFLKSTL